MTEITRSAPSDVLDSRGDPTFEVDVVPAGGATGRAAVPSGALRGRASFVAAGCRGRPTQEKPEREILVTDVGLPGLNGRQVADAARERRPSLPMLFITGYAGTALDRGLPSGMAAIGKPFSFDNLEERVAAMLAAHRG